MELDLTLGDTNENTETDPIDLDLDLQPTSEEETPLILDLGTLATGCTDCGSNPTVADAFVTSVGLSLPSDVFDVTNSPITSFGTLVGTFKTQLANLVFAGPTSGSAAVPIFRALVAADFPVGSPYNLQTVTDTGNVTTNNIGIGVGTATSKLHIKTDAIGVTQSDNYGVLLANTTVATFNNAQTSPPIVLEAQGWKGKSNGTQGASQDVRIRQDALSVETYTLNPVNAHPKVLYRVMASTNGGSYTNMLTMNSSIEGYITHNLFLNGQAYVGAVTGAGLIFGSGMPSATGTGFGGNIAFGNQALFSLTSGGYNVALGIAALLSLTTPNYNTAIGGLSQTSNVIGQLNTSIGFQSLVYNLADQNTALGANTLYNNTTGIKSVAVGSGALENATTGGFNIGVGPDALLNVITGYRNIGIGWNGGVTSADGYHNIGIGYQAGNSISGAGAHDNIIIGGFQTGYNGSQRTTAINTIVIGSGAYSTTDNQAIWGNSSIIAAIMFGAVRMPSYGSGLITGTPTYHLLVDASGNLIEGGLADAITRTVVVTAAPLTAGAVALTDYVYLVSGTTTLTLPTAVGNSNLYTVKNTGVATVIVATTGGQTIDGSSSVTLSVTNGSLDFISDGTNWKIR